MNIDTHKYQIIPILFWIGLGLFVMFFSYKLGIGRLRSPGPGLLPFLLGFLLSTVSFCFLLISLRKRDRRQETGQEEQGQVNLKRLTLVLVSLFAYPLLFETLGFLISTLFILVILFRSTNNKWRSVLFASALTALVSYFLFTSLGIRFPKGILQWM